MVDRKGWTLRTNSDDQSVESQPGAARGEGVLPSAVKIPWMIAVGVGFVLTLMAIALISSTLGGIYAAAVYRFAAEGDAGSYFSADMVRGAFQRK